MRVLCHGLDDFPDPSQFRLVSLSALLCGALSALPAHPALPLALSRPLLVLRSDLQLLEVGDR